MEIVYIEQISVKQRVENYIIASLCEGFLVKSPRLKTCFCLKLTFKLTFLCSSGLNRALSSSQDRGAIPIMSVK